MLIRLLGPIDLVDDHGVVHASPSALRRTLLALMATHRGQVLSPDWLLERAWDGALPDSGRRALRFHLSKLRGEIAAPDLVETRPGGYRLAATDDEVDVGVVERLARAAAHELDPGRAAELCAEALACWRGEPFVDAAPTVDLADEAVRLAELRVSLLEQAHRRRFDAGDGAQLVADLLRLTAAHPLREGLWSVLIAAQYRAGRQADALRSYDALRETLRDTLGVDPSPELQDLHRRVLQHDRTLDPGPASTAGRAGAALPAGIVTFVFTDIEGSTRLMRALGDGYDDVLERHRTVLRDAWRAHDGCEVNVEGDGSLVAFADPAAAVRACAAAQRALAAESWPAENDVRVRMALHRGPATPRKGDYVALAVHQLARVVGCAHGGQVVLTDDVAAHVPTGEGLATIPLGQYQLRDFDRSVRLHQLAGPELPAAFPAIRALPADGHNLVRPPTTFVGREGEVELLRRSLGPGRLVSLVGPGGVGKTRLAVEVGLAVAPSWADGVWMVELAPVSDGDLVPDAIASALGVRTGTGDPTMAIRDHLSGREALVVLDNGEHVIAACAELAASILATAPTAGLLVTSREPIRIHGEVVVRLGPLAVPVQGAGDDETRSSAAAQLFATRAAAVRTGFELDERTVADVGGICRRLDGLPLAIEMAAALVAVQSPAEILDGLQDRFRHLVSHDRDRAERQRTMETTLEWSHRLLTDDERTALRRLSPLVAGFTLDTATEAVGWGEIAEVDVPSLVWSLVDKSLATADLTANATRYRLFDTVRQFAHRRLEDHHESAALATRLATWFLGRAGPWMTLDRSWLGFVGAELDNLRAVIAMLPADEVVAAQQLVASIGQYHDANGTYRHGASEMASHARTLVAPTTSRIALLNRLADLQLRLGDLDAADRTITEAERLRDELGAVPEWDDAGVERARGDLQLRIGDQRGAEATARRALALPLSVRGRARLWNLVGLATAGHDRSGALDAFCEELRLYEELGHEVWIASASGNVAELELRAGDLVGAARHQSTTLRLATEHGSTLMIAYSMIVAARLAATSERWADALTLSTLALSSVRDSGVMLFEDDRRLLDELVERARAELGDARADAILHEADGVNGVTSAQLAAEILDRQLA